MAIETLIIGDKSTNGGWPAIWTEIPALRDGIDNPDYPRFDFVTNALGTGTVYWSKDNDFLYFRVRVNTTNFNLAAYSDSMWIYIDKFRTAIRPDFGFAWDSANTANPANHGLEMQVWSSGTTWDTLKMFDADGVPSGKTAIDINGGGYTTDGYMRAVDGLTGVDTNTTFIDWAVSWGYLANTNRHPAFQLLPTDTWNVSVGAAASGNDHSALGTGKSDIAGLVYLTNAIIDSGPGWSGPLSPQGKTSRTWDGGSSPNANWNSLTNWNPDSLPAEGDDLVFPSANGQNNTNNFLTMVGSVTFTASGYTNCGNALVLNSGITNNISAGTNNWQISTTLGAASTFTTTPGGTIEVVGNITNSGYLLTVDGAGSTLLDGIISGGGGFTKSGAGTATLTAANTYSGATTVGAGKLLVNGSTVAGSAVAVNSGATLGGSGTVNGTFAVSGTVAPGITIGTLNSGAAAWNSGGTYEFQINDALGTAGSAPGWDKLAVTGGLSVNATSGSKFTLKLVSLSGSSPGAAANFDNTQTNSWLITTASGGVSGFAADKFAIDASGFQNSTGTGSAFTVSQSGNNVYLTFAPALPVLPLISSQTLYELATLTVTNTVTTTNIPVTYSLLSAPSGVAISTNGIITWTPTAVQGPSTNIITTRAVNSSLPTLSATNSFTVVVNEVNAAPTLNSLANVHTTTNWSQQTVNLSGIGAGSIFESSQTLTITATSDNPALLPNPTVNYTSPNATGSLTLSPVTNVYGMATVTVVVRDNGGTTNGGADSATNTFLFTEQGFTLTSSANPCGYRNAVSYTANVQATNATGTMEFYTNSILFGSVAVAGGVAVSATTTNLAFGTNLITAIYTGDSHYLGSTSTLNQVVTNRLPVAAAVTLLRIIDVSTKIKISDLLTNVVSPWGSAITLASLGVSTNGVSLPTNATYILYANNHNVTDQFVYVAADRLGGTATNVVTLLVTAFGLSANPPTLVVNSQTINVTFHAIPNYAYGMQRATSMAAPNWVSVVTNMVADAIGRISYLDTFGDLGGVKPTEAYYRLVRKSP